MIAISGAKSCNNGEEKRRTMRSQRRIVRIGSRGARALEVTTSGRLSEVEGGDVLAQEAGARERTRRERLSSLEW